MCAVASPEVASAGRVEGLPGVPLVWMGIGGDGCAEQSCTAPPWRIRASPQALFPIRRQRAQLRRLSRGVLGALPAPLLPVHRPRGAGYPGYSVFIATDSLGGSRQIRRRSWRAGPGPWAAPRRRRSAECPAVRRIVDVARRVSLSSGGGGRSCARRSRRASASRGARTDARTGRDNGWRGRPGCPRAGHRACRRRCVGPAARGAAR